MPLSEEKLSDLQLWEDCYGDSSVKSKVTESGLSQHRHRDRHHYHQHHSRHSHLDSKSAADQKHTAPLLTSPPGLIRRFADCDLTGDCQINETAPLESELPTGSSIPGDNRFSQTSTKLLVSGSGWRGRLFRTFWVCDDRLSSATRVNVQATVTIPHVADRPTNLVVLSSHRLWVKEDGKVRRTMLSKGIEFFCTALNQVGVEGVVHRRS